MEKSIETIWKEGFVSNSELVIPKLNDLYNQKSNMLLDKLARSFKFNLLFLVLFPVILVPATISTDMAILGSFISISFFVFAWQGYKNMQGIKLIDKNMNSYDYLKSLNDWIQNYKNKFEKFYKLFYPLIFIVLMVSYWMMDSFREVMVEIINEHPNMSLFYGIPVIGIIGVVVISFLIYLVSGSIYRFDIKLMYGNTLDKLDELVKDIEELRA